MGRIVHLERFVCCLKIKKEQEWKIRLTDSLVPENNGYFIIKTGIEGGNLIRVENLSEKEKKSSAAWIRTTDRRTVPPAGIS